MTSEQRIKLLTSDSSAEGQKDRVTCQLCRRQFAKYTCPTCNAPYCSLTCFRSPAHNQCSEGFYKKEIETEIHSGPSKSAQERQRMIELLQKFEADSANDRSLDNPDVNDDTEEDPNGLAERFTAVDLDSASESAIWAALTPDERKKFLKALEDPTSQLAQDLLASGELDQELERPWWEASMSDVSHENTEQDSPLQCVSKPAMLRIPKSMIRSVPSGHPLVYNVCAICIAYAYVTRSLAVSAMGSLAPDKPEHHEAQKLLRRLLPFLFDRKSTTLYPDLPSVTIDIWSSFELGQMTNKLFALLLSDAATLLKPRRVLEVTMDHAVNDCIDLCSHPHATPLLVLSDLHALFSKRDGGKPGADHVSHKIIFYAAHIASTPTFILDALVQAIELRSDQYSSMEREDGEHHLTRQAPGQGGEGR